MKIEEMQRLMMDMTTQEAEQVLFRLLGEATMAPRGAVALALARNVQRVLGAPKEGQKPGQNPIDSGIAQKIERNPVQECGLERKNCIHSAEVVR